MRASPTRDEPPCGWPSRRLQVARLPPHGQLDGYRYHRSRHAWDADRHREREAYARGDQFRRYTWADVFDDPTLIVRELRTLLSLE
jgi:hypothetical protein